MVIEHEAGDLTCTVEAATPMPELATALARHGQMLARDPPGMAELTVGDVFDRALFGPRAHRYGLPRDLVLGIRARLADGSEVKGGGKVVKNVAGYDLPKLFTGARGVLGELLELTLRLHPLPSSTATVVAPLGDVTAFEPWHPACVEGLAPEGTMRVRFESRVAGPLARAAAQAAGGEVVDDDEALWAEHRERQAGLALWRCPPASCAEHAATLAERGATRVVGRWARGWLFADIEPPAVEPTPLERRVIERFAAA